MNKVVSKAIKTARLPLCLVIALSLLSGCAGLLPLRKPGPDFDPSVSKESLAPAWVATLPASGLPHNASAANLAQWWQQLNDPVLVDLIAAAQTQSASVAQANARVAQARSGLVQVQAAALPTLDATLAQTRSAFTFGGPVALQSRTQAQLLSGWEIDLFGGRFRETQAAIARAKARFVDWHDAKVSVAAETATMYVQYRFCEQQIGVLQADVKSRSETARLTDIAANAGFQPTSSAAVLRASAADSRRRLIGQQSECAIAIKSMVALTAIPEASLLAKLSPNTATLPKLASFSIASVPASALSQRPDLLAAELELAAASAEIGQAEAAKYPRLSLAGAIGPLRFSSGGFSFNATTWSIGPTISFPLFDGGKQRASFESAKVAYAASEMNYRAKARMAVKEVEESLLRIALTTDKQADTDIAAKGYKEALNAAQSKWQVGIGNLLELEEARRQSLAADVELGILKRDQLLAWVGLYRAVGGGWQPDESASQTQSKK
jgi:outer membrane protein, multidrug efflux system